MFDVFDLTLEQAITRDPDDRAAFAVYADWLQQAGNPRGELAAIQLARETTDTPALQAREAALLEEHADLLCGEPQADGYRIPDHCNELTYRGGFWRTVRFSGPPRVLAALVAHPSARLLHRLAIGYLDGAEDDYTPAVEILVSARLPALRELRIGDLPEGQSALAGFPDRTCGSLAGLAEACPRLEALRLLCPQFELGSHPTLRIVDARIGATPDAIAKLARADLPALAVLELGFDAFEDEDEGIGPQLRWSADTLDPLLANPPAPLLRLWPMPDDAELGAQLYAKAVTRFERVELCTSDQLEEDDSNGAYTL